MAAKAVRRAALGFVVGMAVGNVIAALFGMASGEGGLPFSDALLARAGSGAAALLAQTMLSGALGAVAMAGVCLYDSDTLGLLQAAAIHYAAYTAAFAPIALALGWIETPVDLAMMALMFAITHTCIWFAMNERYKAQVAELNGLLRD